MTGWQSKTSGQKRTIIWNEENRVREIDDNGKGADVAAHMRSGKGALKNPPGTEWHHPADRPGTMQLLPKGVHRDPGLQSTLHPGEGGSGGYAQHYGD